jgi:hypothetical protein
MGSSIGCRQSGEEQSALMSEDRQPEHSEECALPTQWGAIDSLEREWALVALDDGQRLDWPRDRLPPDAKEGMVVELSLREPGVPGVLPDEGTWEGTIEAGAGVETQALPPHAVVRFGTQRLRWPGAERFATEQPVVVSMQVDRDATDRRRREIENLIDDLFG